MLAGKISPDSGEIEVGQTVKIALTIRKKMKK